MDYFFGNKKQNKQDETHQKDDKFSSELNKKNAQKPSIQSKYEACMVLSAVGDAMGYKNGDWQFNTSSALVHQDMMKITDGKGPLFLEINMGWRYSDDTVMQIATAQALISQHKNLYDLNKVAKQIAVEYKKCATKMAGRAPGKTCMKSIQILNENCDNWNKIPFNDRAAGCGGSMRSACIGLAYWRPQQKQVYQLIKVSIQAGRITHHNPIGYLGSMVAAYFTSLAVRNIKPNLWMSYLFEQAFPMCSNYILQSGRQTKSNLQGECWKKFVNYCKKFAEQRNLSMQIGKQSEVSFPKIYGIKQREHFYRQISLGSWPGATGLDSVLIAYDALLGCNQDWQQFCLRGILHGGDNDSTGAIGGAWYGALYGFKGVPERHYKQIQDGKKLQNLGLSLLKISQN